MKSERKYIKYGKLLSGLIHNLNTPLMGLSGRLELLQMKFEDEKSFTQINTQLDKITTMLSTAAYLLDKDQTDRKLDFDLKTFLDNYFSFIYTDMRFKHQIEKELSFESCNVDTNPSDLLNCLHAIIDYLLCFIDKDTTLIVNNTCVENIPMINICLQLKSELASDINICQFIEDSPYHESLKKFEISHEMGFDKISISIKGF